MENEVIKSLVKPEITGDKMETPQLSPQQIVGHVMQLLSLFGAGPQDIKKHWAKPIKTWPTCLVPNFSRPISAELFRF